MAFPKWCASMTHPCLSSLSRRNIFSLFAFAITVKKENVRMPLNIALADHILYNMNEERTQPFDTWWGWLVECWNCTEKKTIAIQMKYTSKEWHWWVENSSWGDDDCNWQVFLYIITIGLGLNSSSLSGYRYLIKSQYHQFSSPDWYFQCPSPKLDGQAQFAAQSTKSR